MSVCVRCMVKTGGTSLCPEHAPPHLMPVASAPSAYPPVADVVSRHEWWCGLTDETTGSIRYCSSACFAHGLVETFQGSGPNLEKSAEDFKPMRFAYADPPYFGCCRLYDHHHPDGLCWDDLDTHRQLIDRLSADYPDGWAMSATSVSLRVLLPLCPPDVRVGAWVKPFHVYKKGVRPAYAWEPLIYRGGRNAKHPPPLKGGKATTPKDFVSCNITLKKGLTGAKPEPVCEWICDLLNVQPGDELVDLYTGTGVMGRVAQARATAVVVPQKPAVVPQNEEDVA